MASGRYDIPDFTDEPIEVLIGNLRKGITTDCAALLAKARRVNFDHRGNGFNLRTWERRITRVREAEVATYCLKELEALRQECRGMSSRLDLFSR